MQGFINVLLRRVLAGGQHNPTNLSVRVRTQIHMALIETTDTTVRLIAVNYAVHLVEVIDIWGDISGQCIVEIRVGSGRKIGVDVGLFGRSSSLVRY